jgi:ABC-type glutathione transport system ATPase component
MLVENDVPKPDESSSERRDRHQQDKRILGYVVQCDGARAVLAAFADSDDNNVAGRWTVGKLISINLGSVRTVGLVYAIGKPERGWNFEAQNPIEVSVELVGEVRDNESGKAPTFDRSITQYPYIGAIAHRIRARDLQAVYDLGGRHTVTIGTLSQDATIAANIAIDETLNRHFAVVGTTGVGKSTAVSLLLRKAADARPDLRIWSSTRTTNSQVRSATNASASMRRHWTCRSGCSGSRNLPKCCSGVAKSCRRNWIFCATSFHWPSSFTEMEARRHIAVTTERPPTRPFPIEWST